MIHLKAARPLQLRCAGKLKNWQRWCERLSYSGAVSFIPRAGFSGIVMVAYLPSEYREAYAARWLLKYFYVPGRATRSRHRY